jgi:hypothetical protein
MSYNLLQGLEVPKDEYSGTVPTLSVEHTEIHAGRMFTIGGVLTVAAAQVGSIQLTVPAQAAGAALVDMTNANADLTYTARRKGRATNDISITHLDPGGLSKSLAVSVSGTDITVSLATNGAGAITSTANQVAAAVLASVEANNLVSVAVEGTGLGVTNAKAKQNLINGRDIVDVHFKSALVAVSNGPATILLKEDASFVAAGTAVTPNNRNRQDANTSQLACKTNANTTVVDGAGVKVLDTIVLGAPSVGQNVVGGTGGNDEEWLLARGAKNYLLQCTNGNAGPITFNYEMTWYERTSN